MRRHHVIPVISRGRCGTDDHNVVQAFLRPNGIRGPVPGVSIGVDDMVIPAKKEELLHAADKEVLEVNARHPIRLNAALPEMAEILRSECQAAILGAKSVEDAATQIDSQFNEALQTFA